MNDFISIQNVLKQAGIDTSNIGFTTKDQFEKDQFEKDNDDYMVENKLKMLDDHNAICSKCKKIINLNTLDIEQRDQVESAGLCPKCLSIQNNIQNKIQNQISMQNSIQNSMQSSIKPFTQSFKPATKSTRGNTTSAGELARSLIFTAMPNITQAHMDLLTDQEYSYINFGVLYSLFLDVTGCSDREIITMKCHKGHSRYTKTKYNILGREYLITNDIYARNVPRIKDKFIELELITEDQAIALGFTDAPSVQEEKPSMSSSLLSSKINYNDDDDEIIEDWSEHKEESIAKRIRREQREAKAALLSKQEKMVKTVNVLNFSNSSLIKTKVAKQIKQVESIDIEAIRKQAKIEAERKLNERKNSSKKNVNFTSYGNNKLRKDQIKELNENEKFAQTNM